MEMALKEAQKIFNVSEKNLKILMAIKEVL
jgi:hypothetical protein